MGRLTIEYCGGYVPKELCSIDRLGGADDCDLCCEYCKATEEGNEDCRGCAINKCFNMLAEYEDAEEQGKLLKLPCVAGNTVYHLCTFKNGESEIIEMKVGCVEPFGAIRNHNGVCEVWNAYAETDYTKEYFKFFDFGRTVFITREEAEAALEKIGQEEGEKIGQMDTKTI